jgi:hypothetical protein
MPGDRHSYQGFFLQATRKREQAVICVCDGTRYTRSAVLISLQLQHECLFIVQCVCRLWAQCIDASRVHLRLAWHCVDTWRIRLCWLLRRYVMKPCALFGNMLARNKWLLSHRKCIFGYCVDTSRIHPFFWAVGWLMTNHEYVFSAEFVDTSGIPFLWAVRWQITDNFVVVQECHFVGEYVETSRVPICCAEGTRERFSGHL